MPQWEGCAMRTAILGTAMIATMAMGTPAAAAAIFTVTPGSTFAVQPIPVNDFQLPLQAVGLTHYTTLNAKVELSAPSRVKFEYMGSESGFTDSFKAGSLPAFFENNKAVWGPTLIGFANFAGGDFTNVSFSSSGGVVNSTIGTDAFGIFIPGQVRGKYSSSVLYFGFDDQLTGIDDNHDDFIVRVTAVPEPASWAMLIAGFGLVGMTARRRAMQQVTA
jgi:hypothetical protein